MGKTSWKAFVENGAMFEQPGLTARHGIQDPAEQYTQARPETRRPGNGIPWQANGGYARARASQVSDLLHHNHKGQGGH